MGRNVLIIEDESKIRSVVKAYLEREGYRVMEAGNGPDGLKSALDEAPDIVILDLMLPGMPGEEVCRRLRAESQIPIIILTAKGEELDRVQGLKLGADDYVVKPFSPRELVARVEAVLRRSLPEPDRPLPPLVFPGGLEVDRKGHVARLADEVLPLTAAEFRILAVLAARPGQAITRSQIVEAAFGFDYDGDERTVDVHVKNLRQKLSRAGGYPYIETVYGVGYRFGGGKGEAANLV